LKGDVLLPLIRCLGDEIRVRDRVVVRVRVRVRVRVGSLHKEPWR